MLEAAVHALLSNANFQLSGHSCGFEDRGQPHCFFAAVSSSPCSREKVTTLIPEDRRGWAPPPHRDVRQACEKLLALTSTRSASSSRCANGMLSAWRRIASAVLTVQPHLQAHIERTELDAQFGDAWRTGEPFGAVHIRRRDKVAIAWWGAEARQVPVCDYATALAQLAESSSNAATRHRRVFVATDDAAAAADFGRCHAVRGWRIQAWPTDAEPSRGANRSVVHRLWAEMTLMLRANWVVVTCTSNIGRMVQMLRRQPPHTLRSVDTRQAACTQPAFRGTIRANASQRRAYADQERRRGEMLKPWGTFLMGHGIRT